MQCFVGTRKVTLEKRYDVIKSLRCEGVKEFRHRVIAHVLVTLKIGYLINKSAGRRERERERLRIRKNKEAGVKMSSTFTIRSGVGIEGLIGLIGI
jgi:hypothetical protein